MSNIDDEIEILASILGSVDLEENNNQDRNMATNGTNYQLLRLFIDTIPPFDGSPHTLGIFLEHCQSLIVNFGSGNDPGLNAFVIRAIISKLSGRALTLIGSRTELRTWQQIKDILTLSFGDQRNLDCLVQDLIILRPHKNETPYNFGVRCQDARSLIISKINMLEASEAEKLLKIENYNELALKTFIRGLSGPIQNNVRLRDPNSLEKAMSLVIEEENFLYSQSVSNSLNSQRTYKPMMKITPVNTSQRLRFPQMQMPYFQNFAKPQQQISNIRPQLSQNFTYPNTMPMRSQFSQNNPHNNNMSWKPNTNFPTQRHPFFMQRPSAIKRQEQKYMFNNRQNFKPEPMEVDKSGISRATTVRPNFTSQELFTQDVNYFENPFESDDQYVENIDENYFYDANDPNQNELLYEQEVQLDTSVENISHQDTNVNFPLDNQINEKT